MLWYESHRFDADVLPLADRHYSRRKIGSPQFVTPGRCLVLKTRDCDACWVTSWPFAEFVKHAWGGAWICSFFRNESPHRSSDLIREAVSVTRWEWPEVPSLGMITFIDAAKTLPKEVPGWCYRCAGFKRARCPEHGAIAKAKCEACAGRTKGGLIALQLFGNRMPAAAPMASEQGVLFR